MPRPSLSVLHNLATQLRIDSVRSTSEAGSGHPTTCLSAADIMAALFFAEMRFDPKDPHHPEADRFVLSKGHGAPILYAAWAAAGAFPREELLKLRTIGSDLEGHPTPRLPFVDVATGSLGQGLPAAIGIALNARRIGSDYRTYVLLGDGETAEGSVWEAAEAAATQKLDNLCAITDVNRLGQSQPTQWGHDLDAFVSRYTAFGWHAIAIDGHDLAAILAALDEARATKGKPTMIVARTLKGKGVKLFEDKENWHGKPLKKGPETDQAIAELEAQYIKTNDPAAVIPKPAARKTEGPLPDFVAKMAAPTYKAGDAVATREAFGEGLVTLGAVDARVVVLDADVKNSTYTDKFQHAYPDRFYENFIAEQVMVGAAMGLASRGAIAFPATFACFLERAADFVRMAGISRLNLKLAGTHAGISIGEDGPSQMALEDLAMARGVPDCSVLYPCDAVSTIRLMALAAATPGPAYLRLSRPKTPTIYSASEAFPLGGSKTLRETPNDRVLVVAAGVTVFEALKAHDALAKDGIAIRVVDAYSIQPIDRDGLVRAARATGGRVITVEDHYANGGLGDAVSEALWDQGARVQRLAVREIPRSGKPDELIEKYGISAKAIVAAVKGFKD
ncbi:MAG TPA: transketolase [Vicinamibacterales bacterium]|nr:transketolase [Vicinamibacterales bacterium]